jgi:hypothetical protein
LVATAIGGKLVLAFRNYVLDVYLKIKALFSFLEKTSGQFDKTPTFPARL